MKPLQHYLELQKIPILLYLNSINNSRENFLLDSKYKKNNPDNLKACLVHLNLDKQDNLICLFKKSTRLFLGKCGTYTKRKIKLHLKQGAKPKHFASYAVPIKDCKTFQKELEQLIGEGIFE